jgi:hypothetical protein
LCKLRVGDLLILYWVCHRRRSFAFTGFSIARKCIAIFSPQSLDSEPIQSLQSPAALGKNHGEHEEDDSNNQQQHEAASAEALCGWNIEFAPASADL